MYQIINKETGELVGEITQETLNKLMGVLSEGELLYADE